MDYIYANLNEAVVDVDYRGLPTSDTVTTIDNSHRTIKVDVIQLSPDKLLIQKPKDEGTYILRATYTNGEMKYEWVPEYLYFTTIPIASNNTVVGGHIVCGSLEESSTKC